MRYPGQQFLFFWFFFFQADSLEENDCMEASGTRKQQSQPVTGELGCNDVTMVGVPVALLRGRGVEGKRVGGAP